MNGGAKKVVCALVMIAVVASTRAVDDLVDDSTDCWDYTVTITNPHYRGDVQLPCNADWWDAAEFTPGTPGTPSTPGTHTALQKCAL